jgi:hypothetical protein
MEGSFDFVDLLLSTQDAVPYSRCESVHQSGGHMPKAFHHLFEGGAISSDKNDFENYPPIFFVDHP